MRLSLASAQRKDLSVLVITQEEGPSPAEKRDLQRIQKMCADVTVCRDGDEEGIIESVSSLFLRCI